MDIVNEYCQQHPNAIKEVTGTFSHREGMRKWYAEAKKAAPTVPTPPKDPLPGREKVAAKVASSRESTDPVALFAKCKEELDRGEVPTFIVFDDDEDDDEGVVENAAKKQKTATQSSSCSSKDVHVSPPAAAH